MLLIISFGASFVTSFLLADRIGAWAILAGTAAGIIVYIIGLSNWRTK